MGKYAIGVDIGGTHITCQLFDLRNNLTVNNSKVRMHVDSKLRKEDLISAWADAIKKSAETVGFDSVLGIGFAMPGPFDYKNGIAWFDKTVDKFQNLYQINIRHEIHAILNVPETFSIRFLNDASCFAVGESWIGVASDNKRVIALTLGTGFGSTFIKNKLPIAGDFGIPADGFLYHVPYKNSNAEEYFSSRWFTRAYKEKTGIEIQGVKELVQLSMKDQVALGLFHEYGANLGEFLVPWVTRFNAEGIVLGGNISKSYSLFKENMENSFIKNGISIKILLSQLDETAALFGSAKLCDDHFYNQLLEAEILK